MVSGGSSYAASSLLSLHEPFGGMPGLLLDGMTESCNFEILVGG